MVHNHCIYVLSRELGGHTLSSVPVGVHDTPGLLRDCAGLWGITGSEAVLSYGAQIIRSFSLCSYLQDGLFFEVVGDYVVSSLRRKCLANVILSQ